MSYHSTVFVCAGTDPLNPPEETEPVDGYGLEVATNGLAETWVRISVVNPDHPEGCSLEIEASCVQSLLTVLGTWAGNL